MKWEAVFFDFDGVIVDSANIKTEAFAEMFRPYGPDIESKVIDYHIKNMGESRYEKFRYWYTEYLGQAITEDLVDKLSKIFSELVVKKILEAPYRDGAINTLKELTANSIPTFLVSGTPDEEIRYITKARGIDVFFKEIHGAPRHKDEITYEILQRHKYNPKNCLFVGDAISDYTAALNNGIRFLGIVTGNAENLFPSGTMISKMVMIDLLV
jgi:HAD superfamily hydrolase (TIGR01549 family)